MTFHWLQCILDQMLKWTSGCKFISQVRTRSLCETNTFRLLALMLSGYLSLEVWWSQELQCISSNSNVSVVLTMWSPAVPWSCYFLFRATAQHISGWVAWYTGFIAQLNWWWYWKLTLLISSVPFSQEIVLHFPTMIPVISKRVPRLSHSKTSAADTGITILM